MMLYWVFKANPLVSMPLTLSIMIFSLLKSTRTVFSLSISVLFTSTFYLAKFDFAAKLDVSKPAAQFKSAFVA